MQSETYCLNCRCKQPYRVKKDTVNHTVRGVRFSCEEETAICSVCGEEVYAPEVNDRNCDYRERAYRRARV